MISLDEFLFEALLCESPAIVDSLHPDGMRNIALNMVNKSKIIAKNIGNDMYKHTLPSGHVLFHMKDDVPSDASIFKISGNDAIHQIGVKFNSDSTGVYANMQHMLDNGYTVKSDMYQSNGGRNLWKNIHKHVSFSESGIDHLGKITNVADFSSQDDSNHNKIFFIRK